MSDGPLLNDVTRAFAEAHRNEDVRDLALKTKRTADLDLPAALDQIAGWQIARNKLPQWAACADIVYPAHIPWNQCSCSSQRNTRPKSPGVCCDLCRNRRDRRPTTRP